METIYCVEDDENIRELVLYALSSSGYAGQGFPEGESFLRAVEHSPPDLALLDIMLPGQSGLDILRCLREMPATARLPVIMLTAKTSEYDRVKGLDSGADDYISKPFGVMELLSRIRAVLRRVEKAPAASLLTAGRLTVDPARRTVTDGDRAIALTFKEFELLACLLRNRELVLTREKLMELVWGFDFEGESRTVDMHIKSLRQKLGPLGELIQTVRGVGYKLSEAQP
ncbi:MAG: response regulator transcription factor [Angelakisella sp.]|nr:response regulator transcription factor [Angelakisella sp.]